MVERDHRVDGIDAVVFTKRNIQQGAGVDHRVFLQPVAEKRPDDISNKGAAIIEGIDVGVLDVPGESVVPDIKFQGLTAGRSRGEEEA